MIWNRRLAVRTVVFSVALIGIAAVGMREILNGSAPFPFIRHPEGSEAWERSQRAAVQVAGLRFLISKHQKAGYKRFYLAIPGPAGHREPPPAEVGAFSKAGLPIWPISRLKTESRSTDHTTMAPIVRNKGVILTIGPIQRKNDRAVSINIDSAYGMFGSSSNIDEQFLRGRWVVTSAHAANIE